MYSYIIFWLAKTSNKPISLTTLSKAALL